MLDTQLLFFEALWGDSKLYRSIWYGDKGKPPIKVRWFNDTRKAVEFANKISQTPHYNVFHACSLFDTNKRQQIHVKETRAFWIDLDLKDTPFDTVREMGNAYLPKFSKFILGTKFWIIKTGYGLHVYWTMGGPIESWEDHAKELKAYCKENGIIIDNARTCDSASFMRFPGSWNMKEDKPKKAKMVREGILILKNTLPTINNVLKDAKKTKFSDEDFNLNVEVSTLNYIKSDAHKIAEKCSVIEAFKNDGLDSSEPLWHQALSVVVRCDNGLDLAHEFSSKSHRYNKDETEHKLERLVSNDIGPCLCSTFESLDDTFCKRCPHKSKIKSCIQLGATCKPVKDSVDDLATAKQKERAEKFMSLAPQNGWLIGKEGIYRLVDEIPVCVSHTRFYVIDKFCEDVNDDTVITALIRAFTDVGVLTFKLPLKWIAEDRKLLAEFNGRGIFPFNKKHFKEYLTTYFQNISHIKPVKAVNSLGWQKDGSFVYGSQGECFTKKGKPSTRIIDTKAIGYVKGFESKGTVEEWCKAIDILNSDERFMPHLFSVLCSIGASCLPMTCATGFILSLQGVSGSGKTLAHRLAMSVWGDSLHAGSLGTKDTSTSMLGRLAAIKNLPLRLDEATTLPVATLSNLIYELVNGRGRARATIDGSLSNTAFEWQTLTFVTTNRPLLEHSMIEITEAERYRILELHVETPEGIAKSGRKIFDIMEANYGVVGKAVMDFITNNKQYVQQTLNFYIKKFQQYVDDSKRFWVSCYAEAFTAATIVNKMGLFNVDMAKLFKWAINVLENQTTVNKNFIRELRGFDTREELIGALYDSLAGHIERMTPDDAALNNPIKDIKARLKYIDDSTDILYVRAPALNEFIRNNFSDSVQNVKNSFNIEEPKTIRLGKITARMYELKMEIKNETQT